MVVISSTWFQPKAHARAKGKSRFARKYLLVENRLKTGLICTEMRSVQQYDDSKPDWKDFCQNAYEY